MSNRTDFDNVAQEIIEYFFSDEECVVYADLRKRIETELHDAFVAGQESEASAPAAPYTPELGQMAFGNPWAAHDCPAWVDALVRDLLREIERVFWNRNQREWNRCEDPKIPGVEFRPYYWGSDETEAAKPNLKHGDVEVRWYKHPMRGSSLNVPADPVVLIPWFESALAAIKKADGLPL